jgi:hypothetical protein
MMPLATKENYEKLEKIKFFVGRTEKNPAFYSFSAIFGYCITEKERCMAIFNVTINSRKLFSCMAIKLACEQ